MSVFSLNCLLLLKLLDLNSDQEYIYNIYYCPSTKWIALGKFDQAIMDDDECEWEIFDGTPELHRLFISLNSGFKFWIKNNFSEFIQWPYHWIALYSIHFYYITIMFLLLYLELQLLSHPSLITAPYLLLSRQDASTADRPNKDGPCC